MESEQAFSSHVMKVALDYKGEKRLVCPTCLRRFTFTKSLKMHIETAHRHMCPVCRKSYKNERRLEIHRCAPKNATAIRRKPFLCDSCGASYSSFRNLEIHTRKFHSTSWSKRASYQRRLACNQCPKKFVSERYLQMHITRVHLYPKEKFECAVCGATYNFGSILREHIEVVHLRLYACTICDKDHVTQKSLEAHLDEVHDGASQF